MKLTFQHIDTTYTCDTDRSHSLAITLDFNGEQANFFDTDTASSKPLQLGDFVADTQAGGSFNVDCLSLIPHCNGTHTETVGHITDAQVWIADAIKQPLLVEPTDHFISLATIEAALEAAQVKKVQPQALIVRTLPNSQQKQTAKYAAESAPSFFSVEAMQAIIDSGIEHLLIDLPSVDRMADEGLLTNHHSFWNVPAGTQHLTADTATNKTITEMIYVADSIQDGTYLLNLQAPAFASDAAPSRPVIFELV